jgi:hypothetical protein
MPSTQFTHAKNVITHRVKARQNQHHHHHQFWDYNCLRACVCDRFRARITTLLSARLINMICGYHQIALLFTVSETNIFFCCCLSTALLPPSAPEMCSILLSRVHRRRRLRCSLRPSCRSMCVCGCIVYRINRMPLFMRRNEKAKKKAHHQNREALSLHEITELCVVSFQRAPNVK